MVLKGDIQDRDGAKFLFFQIEGKMPRLMKIFADAGYTGKLMDS